MLDILALTFDKSITKIVVRSFPDNQERQAGQNISLADVKLFKSFSCDHNQRLSPILKKKLKLKHRNGCFICFNPALYVQG